MANIIACVVGGKQEKFWSLDVLVGFSPPYKLVLDCSR